MPSVGKTLERLPRGPKQGGPRVGRVLDGWPSPALSILVALAARQWALRFQPWVTVDGTEYIRFADSLLHGHAFRSIFPPGYPALVALAKLVVFDRVRAAQAVSQVCGALLPWPTWLLARRAIGARWALLPALVVALHPVLILYSSITLSESAYFLALYGALALAAAARPLPGGLSLGAAFAIRPEALLPAAALATRALLRAAPRVSGSHPKPAEASASRPSLAGRRASRLVPLALAAAGFLALAVPCWIYFRATQGEWMITPKVAAAIRAPIKTWREEERRLVPTGAAERSGLLERIAHHGPEALHRYPANALGYGRWLLVLWPAPLLALSLWGLVRRRAIESIPLLHLLIQPVLALSIQSRFLLGAVPALAILAAVPLARVARRSLRIACAVAWLGGAAWCAIANRADLTESFDGYLAAHRAAGLWLDGVAEPEARVMDRKPYVAFYAERPYYVIPDEPYPAVIEAAMAQGIRYLVVDEGVLRVFRPQLLRLVYEPAFRAAEERLEMVYVGGHVRRRSIAIFRVLRPGEPKTGKPPFFDVRWLKRSRSIPR